MRINVKVISRTEFIPVWVKPTYPMDFIVPGWSAFIHRKRDFVDQPVRVDASLFGGAQ